MKPLVYKHIVGDPEDRNNNSIKAYEWQRKLSESKGEFATTLLFKFFTEKGNIPELPQYIVDALDYLKKSI